MLSLPRSLATGLPAKASHDISLGNSRLQLQLDRDSWVTVFLFLTPIQEVQYNQNILIH